MEIWRFSSRKSWSGPGLREGLLLSNHHFRYLCGKMDACGAGWRYQGIDYRITFKSGHIAGQKAGILADLAVAPLPISSCDDRIVPVDPSLGLPPLPNYILGMRVTPNAPAPVKAVADHIRAIFAEI